MAANVKKEEFVYRISTSGEWEELQETCATLGGEIDHSSGFIHLNSLNNVKMTLKRFFEGRDDLFLLQPDSSKVMETAPGPCSYCPSYGYGQSYCNYTSPYITGQFVVEVGDPMPQYVSYPQYEQPLYPALSCPANFPIQSSVVAAANTPARPPVSGADNTK